VLRSFVLKGSQFEHKCNTPQTGGKLVHCEHEYSLCVNTSWISHFVYNLSVFKPLC